MTDKQDKTSPDTMLASANAQASPVAATARTEAKSPSIQAYVYAYSFSHEAIFNDGLHENNDATLSNHWSVPWSDLMMVMFVLFAALLTAQALFDRKTQPLERLIDKPSEQERKVPEQTGIRQPSFEPLMRINVFERSQQAVREANIENVEIVLLDDQSVKVSVQGPMFFELGKADLRKDVRDFLNSLATIIKQTPYQVNVVGHTDDYPIKTEEFPSNWELSVTRASRVVRFLIQQGGVEPKRFTVMGRSKYEPAVPNESDEARALNRRVEIIITREVSPSNEEVAP